MSDQPDYDIAERQYAEIRDLTAKLKAVEEIAQKFAEAARDSCIAGLAQSAKMRQYEDRIAELEAEVDRLRQGRLDYSSVTTTEGLNCSECSDCGHYVDRDTLDPETGQCEECVEDSN